MDSEKLVAVYFAVVVVFGAVAVAGGQIATVSAAANQANLEVTSTSITDERIVEGESTTVRADVTNQGPTEGPFDVTLEISSEEDRTEKVTLASSESTTVSFDPTFSDSGDYDISVNGESAGRVTVLEPAQLNATKLTVSPDPAVENERVAVAATVENTGGANGEFEAELKINGSVEETKTVTVPGGSKEQVTFQQTFSSAGSYEIQVSDTETRTLTVEQAATFSVTETALYNSEILAGESVTVSGTVRNGGDRAGEYTATLFVDGTSVAEQTIELDPGQSETVPFDLAFEERGEYDISFGETSAGTVSVLAPADISVTSATLAEETARAGETVSVEATVENEGDVASSATVTLEIDGETVAIRELTVPGQQSETIEFSHEFTDAGERGVSVNGESAGTVSVLAPAELDISEVSVSPEAILVGNTTTATADIENVGDVEGTFAVGLAADGDPVSERTITVAAGESTTVAFEPGFDSAGVYPIAVGGQRAGEVTVEEPAAFNITDTVVSERSIPVDGSITVVATVENTGDRSGTFDAALGVDGDEVDRERVQIAGGETRQLRFNQQFSSAGSYSINISDETVTSISIGGEPMTRISVNRSDGEGSSDQPATFEILEATVNTTRTVEEKPVDVELTVTNTGDRSGNYTALLRANGNSIGEQQLTVDGRGTESVTLTERFNESGEYRLTLDETTVGTVVVEEPAAFEVTNATVPADFVAPGEPTTAEFEVRNPGNWTGTQVITITADGEQIAQERLTLGPGESEAVVTEFRGTAGEIAIGGTEAGTIEAIQESEPGESESDGDDSSSSIPTLPIVLLLVIAVGVAGIYFVDHGR